MLIIRICVYLISLETQPYIGSQLMSVQGPRSKYWVFTINNPTEAEKPENWDHVVYCVYQLEGGERNTPHWQGYVVLTKNMYLTGVKKLNRRAHWEKRRGTHDEAKLYCSKTETRIGCTVEFGVEPVHEPGKRNDLLSLKRALDEGKTEFEISRDDELFPYWCRFPRAFQAYKRLGDEKERNWHTFTTVLWGPSGTGKTRKVHEMAPDAYWLPRPNGGSVFFDGYHGQEDVVIDEFKGWLPRQLLCMMLDRYPLQVNTKGGSTTFLPKRVWITSNFNPTEWYKYGLGALERRLSSPNGRVVYCGEGWDELLKPCDIPHFFPSSVEAQAALEAHAACTEDRCFVDNPNCVEDSDSNQLACAESIEDLWCNFGNTIDDCISEDELKDAGYVECPDAQLSPEAITDFRRFYADENINSQCSFVHAHDVSCVCSRCRTTLSDT